ncbi:MULTISPECIES: RHS repeat domain-containing protein, partial [unclassified Frankia]|uniref:RHS repeat domain-containing protein n=1 Tax=unclassified Frankia TaxID=2632575 RepID=UPI002AD2A934
MAGADRARARARRLALDAAELRGQAVRTCAHGIEAALADSGIKNRPWLAKAWDAVSAPFRSWDSFVDLCRDVAMVAGVVALFVSGPIGLALVAIALVAGAVVFADTLAKYAQGKASLGQLGLDSLGLIPGGRGVVSVARLGRTAVAVGRGVGRGEGLRLVGAGLRTVGGAALRQVRTATAYGLGAAGRVRETLQAGYQFTKTTASRVLKVDPVDMASGQMILTQVDVELPGLLAWALQRTHLSSYRAGRWFGRSWSSTLDLRLEIDEEGVCYAASDGVLFAYPHPAPGATVLPAEGPRLALTRDAAGAYTVTDPATGHVFHFALPVDGAREVALPLAAITDRNGHRVELGYDAADGTLAEITHSGGYRLVVDTQQDLVTAIRLRGRAGEPDTEVIRYGYDGAGRLIEVVNSSGRPLRFAYDTAG